ncbi:Putative periplasmic protein [hydrothermal vent metagenome]|uniref:Putative periplasmic protein n=1 Tax=hydrothermal vent metagenome TaxID=652676 RepID=A0A1W1EKE8_9ZZZZ
MNRKLLFLVFAILFLFNSSLYANVEYRYSYIPKKIYKNQLFPVTVLAMGIGESSRDLYFKFDIDSPHQPINDAVIVQNGEDCFYTFYFKNDQDSEFKLPLLFIKSKEADVILDEQYIDVSKIKKIKDFCGVIAADMKVKNYQASTFDDKSNLITISLEAYEANIENMKLKNYEQQDIEDIRRDNSKVEANFFIIIPSNKKNLKFRYFNTIKGQYITINIPIKVVETKLTTQLAPNPKDDNFEYIKKMTIISFIIIFLILALWKKDFLYLIIVVLLSIFLIKFYLPQPKVCIKENAKVRILPTDISRVSYVMRERRDEVTQLLNREGFIKIEYNNERVGWVDEKDICQN